MSSLNIKQGDIMLLQLPFSDYSDSKTRPVFVVSSNEFNSYSKDVLVAKITGTEFRGNYSLRLTNRELKTGKLKKTSYIDLGFILTVEKKLLGKIIAKTNERTISDSKQKIVGVFGI